jgi:exodeoxyribonuclease V gamma subunit
MSLLIHRAERADRLVDALGDLLSDPLPDPFATEIVSVPTPGVERWLSQRLSARLGARPGYADGVCAGVDFSSPSRLVARALNGSTSTEAADPWRPEQAVWPLLQVIDDARGEDWIRLLWCHLEDRAGRRWSVARHLAELFAGYASSRPTMVEAWSRGQDVDAAGRPLGPDQAWQAELWRRLRSAVDQPGPAEQISAATRELRAHPETCDLPARLSVFGATRLDPDRLAVLAALSAHRDVHLWLPHPSFALWAKVAAQLGCDATPRSRRRADDRTEELAEHRLLGYLGRDVRELQLAISAAGAETVDHHLPPPVAKTPDTLLGRLQHDIATDRGPRPVEERWPLPPQDRSIVLHASHGPDRQVEVLREVLVGLLADDPTLEPRDIVVMCPDIETFAPLIAAAFGLDTAESEAEHPGHRLRVRLADRSLRQLNPLLAVVSRLVTLAEGRMPASALLDLCSSAPVARKFRFTADELDRLQDLIARAGVRWGLDAERRSRYGLADFGQNTWAAGLDRLLLGVAMDETEQRFIGTALPMDDVDSSDVDLIGRLAECVARVRTLTDACRSPHPVAGWVDLFKQAIDLLTEVLPADRWQLGHAYAELNRIREPAERAGGVAQAELSLSEVADLLAEAFRGRASRANFRTGTLTVASLLPMRAVPHRVVCLLGTDDRIFPRRRRPDGDDITEADPWVGDHDPRSEDRQLLLDAIMAAEDRLIVVFAGLDPRSNAEIPPAVPIGELLEVLELTAQNTDGRPVRDQVVVQHPLQPFDPRNFQPGGLGAPPGFSFDPGALRAVRAGARTRMAPLTRFALDPLPEVPETGLVELADLLRFFAHPVRALLRDRAGLSLWGADDQPDEQIPAQLRGLDRWAVGDRMLRLHLQGHDLSRLRDAEWRRGSVPPRMLGARALGQLVEEVAEVAATAAEFRTGEPERFEVDITLPGTEERLTGLVPSVFGDDVVRVGFSRLSARHRLQAWLELLALAATAPARPWRAVAIGSGGRSVLGPVSGPWAVQVLADLVELRWTGLREPLPFSVKTSAEYARLRSDQQLTPASLRDLDKVWRQDRDDAYERFFGAGVKLTAMLDQPSRAEEERGDLGEPSRFGTLARRVFAPLLRCEDLT